MAGGLRLNAWAAAGALLAVGAVLAWWLPAPWIDWQPRLALTQPWRLWTAAFVHWSPGHLAGNLVATALVVAFGVSAAVPPRAVLAWALAWPLTHLGLLLQPTLLHYGGLSGVLHAGVAVVLVHLLRDARGRARTIGVLVTAGVLLKLLLEAPWGPPLRQLPGWDIAIAPLAHATGAAAGALAMLLLPRQSRR